MPGDNQIENFKVPIKTVISIVIWVSSLVGTYYVMQGKIEDLQVKDYREGNVDKKWKVFESELNFELQRSIIQGHGLTIHKQLNTIMDVLNANKDKIQLTSEFESMYKTIQDLRYNHNKSLEVYKQAPKADVIAQDDELKFVEEYTQKQLNINE